MAQPGVAWGTDHEGLYDTRKLMTATIKGKTDGDEGKLKQIYIQRWIADFGDGLSAWRMERRTRALNLPSLFSNGLNSHDESALRLRMSTRHVGVTMYLSVYILPNLFPTKKLP